MKTKIKLNQQDKVVLDMLTYSETADKLGIKEQREISWNVTNNLLELYVNVLSPLSIIIKGFKINSGYRCKKTNEAVGGTRLSQHILGHAADITCDNIGEMWDILQDMEIDQCIRYKNFIHVSYISKDRNRNQFIDKSLV